jgi:hypothetical protein
VRRAAGLLLLVLLPACNSGSAARDTPTLAGPSDTTTLQQVDVGLSETPEAPNWTDPVTGGVTVDSSSDADVSFHPADPPTPIGEVQRIETSDPTAVPLDFRGIVWVLTDGSTVFNLAERSPTMSQDELEDFATCQPEETGCSAAGWSLVDIGTGSPALLIDGASTRLPASATSIMWLEGDVQFEILGPVQGLSAESAVAKAIAVASAT